MESLPPPIPVNIYMIRKLKMGYSQTEAAKMVHVTLRAWQWWESGKRDMPLGLWELFLIKSDLHPKFKFVKKPSVDY
jgi:hypothetical protein